MYRIGFSTSATCTIIQLQIHPPGPLDDGRGRRSGSGTFEHDLSNSELTPFGNSTRTARTQALSDRQPATCGFPPSPPCSSERWPGRPRPTTRTLGAYRFVFERLVPFSRNWKLMYILSCAAADTHARTGTMTHDTHWRRGRSSTLDIYKSTDMHGVALSGLGHAEPMVRLWRRYHCANRLVRHLLLTWTKGPFFANTGTHTATSALPRTAPRRRDGSSRACP